MNYVNALQLSLNRSRKNKGLLNLLFGFEFLLTLVLLFPWFMWLTNSSINQKFLSVLSFRHFIETVSISFQDDQLVSGLLLSQALGCFLLLYLFKLFVDGGIYQLFKHSADYMSRKRFFIAGWNYFSRFFKLNMLLLFFFSVVVSVFLLSLYTFTQKFFPQQEFHKPLMLILFVLSFVTYKLILSILQGIAKACIIHYDDCGVADALIYAFRIFGHHSLRLFALSLLHTFVWISLAGLCFWVLDSVQLSVVEIFILVIIFKEVLIFLYLYSKFVGAGFYLYISALHWLKNAYRSIAKPQAFMRVVADED